MSTARANLDVTQYVRVTSDPAVPAAVMLQSHRDSVRIVFSDVKPAKGNSVFHDLGEDDPILNVPLTEIGVWALAMTSTSALTVTEQRVPVEIDQRDGMTVGVTLNDATTEMLDLDFLQELRVGLTLAVDSVADSRVITLTAGHGMTPGAVPGTSVYPDGDVGTILEIGSTTTGRFVQAKVLAVSGDDITLSQLVGDVFSAGSSVNTGNRNLALADGSSTPVIFRVEPSPVQAGDITRIIIAIIGPTAMDFSTFGSDIPLSVGLLFRVRRPDGSYKNIRTIDRNLEGYLWGFDNSQFIPKQGNTDHGIAFRVTFAGQDKHGAASRLDGALGVGEQWEVVVLDPLLSGTNIEIRIMAEGSELQE
jgi:hypothetical protein